MRARVVIGANFGDEGKGLVTDWLCSQGAGVVVRFNGGANAGHTVVTPEGARHVFGHLGAGTLLGVPTYLSEFFVVNPLLLLRELDRLRVVHDGNIKVFAHPACVVTTFADMVINQRKEEKRGGARHGSCGVGIHETMQRSRVQALSITMADLWNGASMRDRLKEICGRWAEFRTGKRIESAEPMIEAFENACRITAEAVHPAGIADVAALDPVFEGAQGLLLSQDNVAMRPHLTHSYTGMRNARMLCAQAGIDQVEPYYVSRSYLTRHGAGPLPHENPGMSFDDDTNAAGDFQGALRFAPLDTDAMLARVAADGGGRLILTHCDQLAAPCASHARSYGPTRRDVEKTA